MLISDLDILAEAIVKLVYLGNDEKTKLRTKAMLVTSYDELNKTSCASAEWPDMYEVTPYL